MKQKMQIRGQFTSPSWSSVLQDDIQPDKGACHARVEFCGGDNEKVREEVDNGNPQIIIRKILNCV